MTNEAAKLEILQVWRFVRGDMKADDFEIWASSPDLEARLGAGLYLEVISADYRDRGAVYDLIQRLSACARTVEELRCQCITLPNLAVVDMGEHDEVFATLREEASRGERRQAADLALIEFPSGSRVLSRASQRRGRCS